MPDIQETTGGMEIVPHDPVMQYEVKGYPLNSMDAFVLYANGTEINSLKTTNKTVVGAVNELKDQIDNLDLSDYVTKKELESELEQYIQLSEFTALSGTVDRIDGELTTAKNDISTLQTDVQNIKNELDSIPDNLKISLTTFTNPAYFTLKSHWGEGTSNNYVTFSYTIQVHQNINPVDGILELFNMNFLRNIELDFEQGAMPSKFFVPATVVWYNNNGEFLRSSQITLTCDWSVELNSYDLSVYFRGEIPDVGDDTEINVSASIPYIFKKGESNT